MIQVTLLGTSAAVPTVDRNVSALMLQREGELLLFDCGEGTQRQMMRYNAGFGLDAVFITHYHADHTLGVAGLLRTFGLQGRTAPLRAVRAARCQPTSWCAGGPRHGADEVPGGDPRSGAR